MDRRDSLKTLVLGTIGGTLGLQACKTDGKAAEAEIANAANEFYGRTPQEAAHDKALHAKTFFTAPELATLTALGHLILPASEHGSIEDAGVPAFIEFMAKDVPNFAVPLRGGLAWLNHESKTRFGKAFIETPVAEQKLILDEIAFEVKDPPNGQQPMPVNFFSLVRGLTVTGYYTSAVGVKDLGYSGNQPNVWDGVPESVLAQHGMAYEPEWIAKCINQETRETIATWDDNGNLLT